MESQSCDQCSNMYSILILVAFFALENNNGFPVSYVSNSFTIVGIWCTGDFGVLLEINEMFHTGEIYTKNRL